MSGADTANGDIAEQPHYPVFGAAIAIGVASAVVTVLIIPPFQWHFRNRNFGATVLAGWMIGLNFFAFINAVLWPTDDMKHWYKGQGLCDIEVKVMVAAWTGASASLVCILRALAHILDTSRISLGLTRAEKRRNMLIEVSWTIGCPLLQAALHLIVQPNRYYLLGISGCVASFSSNWLSIVFIHAPGVATTMAGACYCVLIVLRLRQHRADVGNLLAMNRTTKSRFVRLLLLCSIWLLLAMPAQAFTLYRDIHENLAAGMQKFSWSAIHAPGAWSDIITIASGGRVLFDRYIWLAGGIMVFLLFGLGKEAIAMYKGLLRGFGLDRIFQGLRTDHPPTGTTTRGSLFEALGSRVRLLMRRRSTTDTARHAGSLSSQSTWIHGSTEAVDAINMQAILGSDPPRQDPAKEPRETTYLHEARYVPTETAVTADGRSDSHDHGAMQLARLFDRGIMASSVDSPEEAPGRVENQERLQAVVKGEGTTRREQIWPSRRSS